MIYSKRTDKKRHARSIAKRDFKKFFGMTVDEYNEKHVFKYRCFTEKIRIIKYKTFEKLIEKHGKRATHFIGYFLKPGKRLVNVYHSKLDIENCKRELEEMDAREETES